MPIISHRELYESFASHKVRYVLIGGAAVILHGVHRATLDVDILIEATVENAQATLEALRDVGMGTAHLLDAEEVLAQDVTIFDDLIVVDVQTRTPGVVFEDAWERRRVEMIEGATVNVLSLEDLIASKEAAGRPVDLEDVKILRKIAAEQGGLRN